MAQTLQNVLQVGDEFGRVTFAGEKMQAD